MDKLFNTYAFYDQEGRRLAVFCRFVGADRAEIFTLACSRKDAFNKKTAREVYKEYIERAGDTYRLVFIDFNKPGTIIPVKVGETTYNPVIKIIKIEPEQRELATLINFCRKNYEYPTRDISGYVNKLSNIIIKLYANIQK